MYSHTGAPARRAPAGPGRGRGDGGGALARSRVALAGPPLTPRTWRRASGTYCPGFYITAPLGVCSLANGVAGAEDRKELRVVERTRWADSAVLVLLHVHQGLGGLDEGVELAVEQDGAAEKAKAEKAKADGAGGEEDEKGRVRLEVAWAMERAMPIVTAVIFALLLLLVLALLFLRLIMLLNFLLLVRYRARVRVEGGCARQ